MLWSSLFFSVWASNACPVISEPEAVPPPEVFEVDVRKACKSLPELMSTYEKKDEKGTLRVSGECLKGEPNRNWRLLSAKGDALFDWNFKAGEREGLQVSCAGDGSRAETLYHAGVRHGLTRLFDTAGDNVGELIFVEDDVVWAKIVKSGPGWKEIQIGRTEPTRTTRFENNVKVWDRMVLADGRTHEIRWFANGKIESEGDLGADGKPGAPWVSWNQAGEIVSSRPYASLPKCTDGGSANCVVYNDKGRPVSIQEFEKGRPAGFAAWDTGVDERGTFWREERLHDAKRDLVKQTRVEDGIEVMEKIRNSGRKAGMRVTRWHRTGVRAAQGLTDGTGDREEGIWIYWNELGDRTATKKFQHGVAKEVKEIKSLRAGKATASP